MYLLLWYSKTTFLFLFVVWYLKWFKWLCLCFEGVQSARPSNDELSQRIVNTGTVVFLDVVEKFRNTTEKLLRDYQFKKLRSDQLWIIWIVWFSCWLIMTLFLCFCRISVQGYMKTLREFAKQLNTTNSARESQDYSVISAQ